MTTATIIPFPRKAIRREPPAGAAKLHQLLDQAIACTERGDYDGADRLFYTLARKTGFGHMTTEFDSTYPDIHRRTFRR